MKQFDKNVETLIEGFAPIKQTKRFFYPRGFELSPEFVNAYKAEKKRLLAKGHGEKDLHHRVAKALMFH